MVDELTQESFQTGKAIVTVSVDLITAIAEACKRSEEKNPGMSAEQKETLLGKVVDKVVSNYKETHGSLKDFNKEGKDVTSIDVNDERTAEILKKACKKSHIPVDMREVTRADGSVTHTAFCEVKSIDQVASLLKMASEQVLEEQKEMTKTLVLYDEHDQAIISADFVNNGEINMDEVEKMADKSVRFEIKDHKDEVLESGSIAPNAKEEIKEAARKHNPKKDKTLSERIKDKKEQSQKKQKDTEEVEVTDRMIEGLLLTMIHEGPRVIADPDNYQARANIMWAGMMAHNNSCGVGRTQDWTSHNIEHELSALYDCAHGAGLAVVMPAVFTYTLEHNVMRFAQAAVRVWGCQMDFTDPKRTAREGIEALRNFLISIGMPKNFAELGAKEEDIEKLAHICCYGDVNTGTVEGFATLDQKDVENIYKLMVF